ncbi:MAG: TetR/AcrR family transcriptional regulator [Caldisericia bacterium]|nr:TetR/AcrR family transcriptional regulator [Caldisericia bacterium]
MNKSALSKKGEATRNRIIENAIKVFREYGFSESSIKKIAESVGLKNSSVYRYFKNKKDLFNFIIKDFENRLIERVKERIKEEDKIIDKIERFIIEYIGFIKDNREIYDIFREAEFVNLSLTKYYYKKLVNILIEIFNGKIKKCDCEALSYSILGSFYFIIINYFIWEDKDLSDKQIKSLLEFIKYGIDRKGDFVPYLIEEKKFKEEEKKEKEKRGDRTKEKILRISEKLFGKKGFSKTHISHIARESNIGIGTIYLYFKTKKELLKEVVSYLNKSLRDYISYYIKDFKDRREIENAGFQAFFYLFKNLGYRYRIVRESEFVDKEIGSWYYKRISFSYTKRLNEGMEKGEIKELDPEILSFSLMGIGHTLGMRYFVLKNDGDIKKDSILTTLNFIMHGLNYFLMEENYEKN